MCFDTAKISDSLQVVCCSSSSGERGAAAAGLS